jgi:hypothetical protein
MPSQEKTDMNRTIRKQLGNQPSPPPATGKGADSDEPMVTEAEQIRLLQALSRGMREQGQKGFTEGEAHAVWTWAHETRVAHAILESALMGLINIAIREDGEVIFKTAVDPARAAQLLNGQG